MKYLNKTAKQISGGIGALALGLSLSLSGCDKVSKAVNPTSQYFSGTVWNKEYEPERKWLEMRNSTGFTVPVFFQDDEEFIIRVMRKEEGKYENETFYVDKETFNKLSMGDKFVYDGKNAETSVSEFDRVPTKEELKKCDKKWHYKKQGLFVSVCELN
jgi:hypothetical protein